MAKIDKIEQILEDHLKQQEIDTADQKKHNEKIELDIVAIKDNHLAHLKEDIYKLKSKVNGVYLVAGVFAPILIFLMNKYL